MHTIFLSQNIHTILIITNNNPRKHFYSLYQNKTYHGGIIMYYVAPEIRDRFESLSPALKNIILEKNVQLNTIHDLIRVLEEIVSEAENEN